MTARKLIFTAAAVLALAFVLAGCGKSDSAKAGAKYYCPMHPTYVSDRPGDCPICNMKLVPIKDSSAHTTAAPAAGATTVPGRTPIMLDATKRQAIGLTTSPVAPRDLSRSIRTTAVVTHDETRFARVAPRFGGWIRKLYVNSTGQPIAQGEPLFMVYSPELLAAGNEYLVAARGRSLSNSPPAHGESANRLLEIARRRLELLGVGGEEIRALEERGKADDEILVRAPFSGHVITRNAVEGKAFMAGETLYEIADLSHLWLRAYVYEYELPTVKTGQKARITLPNLADKTYDSEVTFIYPHLDPQTRRAEVRLEVDNPGHTLRPDMWANVDIEVESKNTLSVPASAVIDTGMRQIAFVARADEHLEPREVKIGMKTDDYWEVLGGLKEGEQVVTRALFLVDSESQLKAAISGMGGEGGHKH